MITLFTDPAFYALAVPAALLVGLSKSGFAAGIAALATPLLAISVGVPQAAALLLPLLCLADILSLFKLRRHADGAVLRQLLPAGLVGIVVGWLSFGLLPGHVVAGITGAVTLLFLAWQVYTARVGGAGNVVSEKPPGALGTRALALTSGYTSFVAHSGGPPIVIALLARQMAPLAFSGTTAVFFTVINAAKWLPYGLLGLLDFRNLATSVALMPVAAAGVGLGIWATKRVSATWFFRLVQIGMLLTGLKLLADGLWHG